VRHRECWDLEERVDAIRRVDMVVIRECVDMIIRRRMDIGGRSIVRSGRRKLASSIDTSGRRKPAVSRWCMCRGPLARCFEELQHNSY